MSTIEDELPSPARASGRRRFRRFRRDERGATAVEFGLVAMPFFALLFAIMEIALVLWTTQVVETAVADASRQLYTGQFNQTVAAERLAAATAVGGPQPQPTEADVFKALVCEKIKALTDCSKLRIDVKDVTATGFPASVTGPVNVKPDGTREYHADFGQYGTPAANRIVLVRAFVEFPIFTSFLDASKTSLSPDGRSRVIMASAAFKTEPF
jgi:pilus assembly protein Flp/PilA